MDHIATVKKTYPLDSIFFKRLYGENIGRIYECDMYRSFKGNFLLVREESCIKYGEAITEDEAKRLMMEHDYNAYVKLYGALEEA